MAEASDMRYEPTEVIHVATSEAGRETIERTRASEHPMGSPSEHVEGSELRDVLVVPEIREESIESALYRPNGGYFRSPESLVHAFADRAAAAGATIATGTEITDITVREGRVEGAVADGERHAGAVVCAAGPWNNAIADMAGVDLPVRQERLHLLELEPSEPLTRTLPKIRHVETGITFRGRPNGRVLVYHAEPAEDPYAAADVVDPDEPAEVPESVTYSILESVESIAPILSDAEIVHEDVAYTSRTPDGNPVVGWTDTPGFSIAALHSRGIQYAPAIGDVITRQLVDDDPTAYYSDVSIGRFDGYTDDRP
jgi:sarcosine oxidase subunit beta